MSAAFQIDAFQNDAFQTDGSPVPVVVVDTHDDVRRKKRWDEDKAKREARRNDILAAYDLLVEGRPEVAAGLVDEFIRPSALETAQAAVPPARSAVDWDSLLARADALDRMWNAFLDMDDEDVVLLL